MRKDEFMRLTNHAIFQGVRLRTAFNASTPEMTMKTILAALVSLAFVAGAVAPAAAAQAFSIKQLDKEGRGGHFN